MKPRKVKSISGKNDFDNITNSFKLRKFILTNK